MALWGLAVAQPLFDVLGEGAEFFAVRDSTRWDILGFAVGIVLIPPAAILGLEALAGLVDRRVARVVHLTAVAALGGLLALQIAADVSDRPSDVLVPAAALAGLVGALVYARYAAVQSLLTVLAVAPLVFLALFLLSSPVRTLVFGTGPEPRVHGSSSQTPVVVVVFDEISTTSLLDEDGAIDAERYPSFAELARGSTWFRNAATVDAWTVHAVPAILTGLYSEHGRLPVFSEHPDNLFTLLGGSHRLEIFESLTQLCPRTLCPDVVRRPFPRRMSALLSDVGVLYPHLVLPRDLREQLPSVSNTWGAFLESSHERTRRRITAFEAFLASLDGGGGPPPLAFAHVMLPHPPWEFLPSGRRYAGGDLPGLQTGGWGTDEFLVEQGYQRYLLQLGFADRLLGRLLDRLRATGLYDQALIVVAADHGVSFRTGERRRAFRESNLDDVAFAPLFVKRPGEQVGRIVDEPVQTIDVLPTIADVLGLEVPWNVEGTSLFDGRGEDEFLFVGDRGRFTADPQELIAQRDESLRRQVEALASGLYGFGPNPELIGESVDRLAVEPPGEARADLDQAEELRSVNLRSEVMPARLTGTISGGEGGRRDLAAALAGRIVAVGRTYFSGGEERFSILIPESALRQGANRVELLWVQPGGALVPL
ncbi:MAG: sulfatase-like hydrolase/transferase [Gaiellaceae bacterium]